MNIGIYFFLTIQITKLNLSFLILTKFSFRLLFLFLEIYSLQNKLKIEKHNQSREFYIIFRI